MTKRTIVVQIDNEVDVALRHEAASRQVSKAQVVRDALDEHLQKEANHEQTETRTETD